MRRQRRIDRSDIDTALAEIEITHGTPEDSTCIVGMTRSGRLLRVWVVGAYWPQEPPLIVKSVAWKDEER